MCLTEPSRVVALDEGGRVASVGEGDRAQRVLLAVLTADGVRVAVGDWLLVNAGVAVARIDAGEAAELRDLVHRAREGATP